MKLPFGFESVDALCKDCEQQAAGYYPIGTGSFWHSGIHIYRSSKELFEPIIPGNVVMYRISEKYKMVQLPEKLTDSEYTELFSGNANRYTRKGVKYELKEASDNVDNKVPVSDCFIMLKHTVTINQLNDNKMSFYTLYMNLAPIEEYAKNCYDDKIKIGNTIQHPGKEGKEFPISKVGMPGLNNKERYIDVVVITEKKIFLYNKRRLSRAELSLFYGLHKSAKWYSQKIAKPVSKKYFIPKHTTYEIIEPGARNGQLIAKRIRIKSIRVYLLSKNGLEKAQKYEPNETYKLNNIEMVFFSNRTKLIESESPENTLDYLHSKLFGKLRSMLNQKVKLVAVTKEGQPAIDVELSGSYSIPDFWIDGDLSSSLSTGIMTNDELALVYNDNPIAGVFAEENITDEDKAEVTDIMELEYQDKNGKKYYKVANKPDRYITEEDRNACFKLAFSWDVWFQEVKESTGNCDDIFCDRTALFKESIKWYEDKRLQFALAIMPISIFWSGVLLTWVYLEHVFGKKEKFAYAEDLCKQLRKIACIHPIEWDQTKFSGIKTKKENKKWSGPISKEMAKYLEDVSVATDIWKDGLSNIFTTNNLNFVHPLYFINHLDRAKVFGFNPYLNQQIPAFTIEKGDVTGNHRENKAAFIVKSNPGFAPLTSEDTVYKHDGVSYARCTSPFGIKRYSTVNPERPHSGIDLAPTSPNKNTKIICFIYGQVWAYTHSPVYGNLLLIKSTTEDKLYLLAHLKDKLVNPGDLVSPSQEVAITGQTGPAGTPVHLHLEVRECSEKDNEKVLNGDENKAPGIGKGLTWFGDYARTSGPRTMDPFNH